MESRMAGDKDGGTRRIGDRSGGSGSGSRSGSWSGRGTKRYESLTKTKSTRCNDIDDVQSMSPLIMEIIDMAGNTSDVDTNDARRRRRTKKYSSPTYTAQRTNERSTPTSKSRTAHHPDNARGGRSRTRHGSGGSGEMHDRKERSYHDDDYHALHI